MILPFNPAYLKAQGVQILDPVPAATTKPAELPPNERRDPADPCNGRDCDECEIGGCERK